MAVTIGVFGFGKTGRVVAQEILNDPAAHLSWVVRKSQRNEGEYASALCGFKSHCGTIYSASGIDPAAFYKDNPVDVIIDFSSSSAVHEYRAAASAGARIVSAISRYEADDLAALRKMANKTAVLYSPNITLGINFLMIASQVLQRMVPDIDIEIVEEHFRAKKEVSGTALRIAELLGLSNEHHVNSIRVGGIVGRHEVIFGFPNQTIRITHESISRAAFARGALYAAKWLMNRKKGLYTMEQVVAADFVEHSRRIHRKK